MLKASCVQRRNARRFSALPTDQLRDRLHRDRVWSRVDRWSGTYPPESCRAFCPAARADKSCDRGLDVPA